MMVVITHTACGWCTLVFHGVKVELYSTVTVLFQLTVATLHDSQDMKLLLVLSLWDERTRSC